MNRKILRNASIALIAIVMLVGSAYAAVSLLSNTLNYSFTVVDPTPMSNPILLTETVGLPSTVVIGTENTVIYTEVNSDPNFAYECTTYFTVTAAGIVPADVDVEIIVHYTDGKPDWGPIPMTFTQDTTNRIKGELGPWTALIGHDNTIDVTVTFKASSVYTAQLWVEGEAQSYVLP